MLLYLACSDLAGFLLGSPKMPASGALEYREYHVNQLAWAKTTACQSSALLSSALLSYIFAPLSFSLLDPAQFLGILSHFSSRLSSPSQITYHFPQYSLDLNMGESG